MNVCECLVSIKMSKENKYTRTLSLADFFRIGSIKYLAKHSMCFRVEHIFLYENDLFERIEHEQSSSVECFSRVFLSLSLVDCFSEWKRA